ncbi:MAG: hypothetical protein LBQ27_04510 [Clostridiales bacterium]|nr:hypothetical protein [Clostridiales bacterium]
MNCGRFSAFGASASEPNDKSAECIRKDELSCFEAMFEFEAVFHFAFMVWQDLCISMRKP